MSVLTLKILCFVCLYGIYHSVSAVYRKIDTMDAEEFTLHLFCFGSCVLAPLLFIWLHNV